MWWGWEMRKWVWGWGIGVMDLGSARAMGGVMDLGVVGLVVGLLDLGFVRWMGGPLEEEMRLGFAHSMDGLLDDDPEGCRRQRFDLDL